MRQVKKSLKSIIPILGWVCHFTSLSLNFSILDQRTILPSPLRLLSWSHTVWLLKELGCWQRCPVPVMPAFADSIFLHRAALASLGSQFPVSPAFLFVLKCFLGFHRGKIPSWVPENEYAPLPLLLGGLPAACLASQLRRNDVRDVYLLSKLQSSFQQNKKKTHTQKGVQGHIQSVLALREYPFSMSCLSQQCLQERPSWPSWWYQLSKPNHGHFMSQDMLVAQD